jgi:hypothetical protein
MKRTRFIVDLYSDEDITVDVALLYGEKHQDFRFRVVQVLEVEVSEDVDEDDE